MNSRAKKPQESFNLISGVTTPTQLTSEPLVELFLDHLGGVLVVGGVLLAGVDAHLQHLRPHVLVHVSLIMMLTISLGVVPV